MNALRILARVTGKSPGEVAQYPPLRSSSSPVALSRTRLHTNGRLRCIVVTRRWVPVHACWRLADRSTTPNLEELGQLHLQG